MPRQGSPWAAQGLYPPLQQQYPQPQVVYVSQAGGPQPVPPGTQHWGSGAQHWGAGASAAPAPFSPPAPVMEGPPAPVSVPWGWAPQQPGTQQQQQAADLMGPTQPLVLPQWPSAVPQQHAPVATAAPAPEGPVAHTRPGDSLPGHSQGVARTSPGSSAGTQGVKRKGEAGAGRGQGGGGGSGVVPGHTPEPGTAASGASAAKRARPEPVTVPTGHKVVVSAGARVHPVNIPIEVRQGMGRGGG